APHDRGRVQGVRAGPSPGRRARPHGGWRAQHQGHADRMSALLEAPVQIAVVDYGMGNRRSVEKALLHVGVHANVTSDAAELRAADGLVVPGVGAFPRAMESLRT